MTTRSHWRAHQRQVERVLGIVRPEVEIPRPDAGEEMDVGEPTVRVVGPVEDQPIPTVRVGGSSSMKRTQMIVKRNVSDSQRV